MKRIADCGWWRTHLTTVFTAILVSGAEKVPRDGLQVFAIAVAVFPNRQTDFTKQWRTSATCTILLKLYFIDLKKKKIIYYFFFKERIFFFKKDHLLFLFLKKISIFFLIIFLSIFFPKKGYLFFLNYFLFNYLLFF